MIGDSSWFWIERLKLLDDRLVEGVGEPTNSTPWPQLKSARYVKPALSVDCDLDECHCSLRVVGMNDGSALRRIQPV